GGGGVLGIIQGRPAAAAADRNLVAGKLVVCQQFPQLELDQLQQLLVVHEVDLVEKDNERGHADLAGQKDMLPRLGIGPSAAETTRIAPSIWAAPVIMFLM